MRSRFLASLFAAVMAAAFAAPAGAEPGQWVEPPKKLPHVQHGDSPRNLDFLFGALKVERTEQEIEIARRISVLDMGQLFRRLDPLPRLGTGGRGKGRGHNGGK